MGKTDVNGYLGAMVVSKYDIRSKLKERKKNLFFGGGGRHREKQTIYWGA